MIPYVFYKNYGYDSILVTYQNGNYPLLDTDVRGLRICFLPEPETRSNEALFTSAANYIRQNALEIDILNLYDISASVVRLTRLYKKLNPRGRAFVKLDRGFNYKNSRRPLKLLRERVLEVALSKVADLVSVESTDARVYILKNTLLKPEYIPNGFISPIEFDPAVKTKTILFVGDVSLDPKRLDLVLDAFSDLQTQGLSDWTLRFVGPIKDDFTAYWDQLGNRVGGKPSRIQIAGPQYDRNLLDEEYRRASVFVLASDHESFGIVLPEAIRAACIPVVSSGVASANDITDFGRLGFVFERGSAQSLSSALSKAIERAGDTSFLQKIVKHSEAFYWPTICSRIKDLLGEP